MLRCLRSMPCHILMKLQHADIFRLLSAAQDFIYGSVLYDTEFTSCDTDYELRQKLFDLAKENGNDALHAKLLEVDPVSAEAIHANNVKRVVRAIEYHTLTGECISEHNTRESMKSSPYNFAYFVINMG